MSRETSTMSERDHSNPILYNLYLLPPEFTVDIEGEEEGKANSRIPFFASPSNVLAHLHDFNYQWRATGANISQHSSELVALNNHVEQQPRWTVSLSPNANCLAIVQDKRVSFRFADDGFCKDRKTRKLRNTLSRNPQWRHVVWSPDSKFLVIASRDGAVLVVSPTAHLADEFDDTSTDVGVGIAGVGFCPLFEHTREFDYDIILLSLSSMLRRVRLRKRTVKATMPWSPTRRGAPAPSRAAKAHGTSAPSMQKLDGGEDSNDDGEDHVSGNNGGGNGSKSDTDGYVEGGEPSADSTTQGDTVPAGADATTAGDRFVLQPECISRWNIRPYHNGVSSCMDVHVDPHRRTCLVAVGGSADNRVHDENDVRHPSISLWSVDYRGVAPANSLTPSASIEEPPTRINSNDDDDHNNINNNNNNNNTSTTPLSPSRRDSSSSIANAIPLPVAHIGSRARHPQGGNDSAQGLFSRVRSLFCIGGIGGGVSDRDLKTLHSIRLSPDGKKVACIDLEGTLFVYQIAPLDNLDDNTSTHDGGGGGGGGEAHRTEATLGLLCKRRGSELCFDSVSRNGMSTGSSSAPTADGKDVGSGDGAEIGRASCRARV
eukprot:TRINITY_DN2494_c0_g1_i1.p1 TRINITY_DN2494_c0_g1~~TRINITY_DN2494_c0_g1_i1.p1  ORF type:complete len:601 (+),score=119.41 TRINITY_DN2494_c0_g1_i1:170-1972(+)